MNNLITAIAFILTTLFDLYITVILLRVILQYIRAPFSNDLGEFIIRVTDPGVKIFRKFIPGYMGVDCASLVLAYLLAFIKILVINTIKLQFFLLSIVYFLSCVLLSLFTLLDITLSIYFWSIIILVVSSLIAQGQQLAYSPFLLLVSMIAEPVLRPIRRVIPPIAGFDLSPLFACLIIAVLRILFSFN
jgi:YggT family protein